MFVKIIAGVLAAVAVTGVGVYVAMPDTPCGSCCPLNRTDSAPLGTAEDAPGCCSMTTCVVPPASNESLAACTGGMSFVSTTKAKPAHACCSDE